jgi:cation transport ATPase
MFRSICISLFLLLGTYSVSGAQKNAEIIVKTAVACDHCNVCETCKSRVESALFKVKGVKLCEMNSATQTIRVVYNPGKTNEDAIRKTICSCGYDADDKKATEEERGKLDDCCRKKE